jgi:hypothetical protein
MPGCSGGPVVTNARVYYTPRAAAGASAPGIPHALMGGQFLHNSGASRRENANLYLAVTAKEHLRRSNPAFLFAGPKLDCFASLATTTSSAKLPLT